MLGLSEVPCCDIVSAVPQTPSHQHLALLLCIIPCRELVELKEHLNELQQQRQREAAAMSTIWYGPHKAQTQKLQRLDDQINNKNKRLTALTTSLQEQQDLVARLDSEKQQLHQSVAAAQQLHAAKQVQEVADTLLEMVYAFDSLMAAVSDVLAGPGTADVHRQQTSDTSPAVVRRLNHHMQLVEAVSNGAGAHHLEPIALDHILGYITSLLVRVHGIA